MAVKANPNLKQRTLLMAGLAIIIIAGMVANQVWQTYGTTIATARRGIQQFTQILEANTDVTFQSVTLILDHAVEAALDQISAPKSTRLVDRFITIADGWPFIHAVSLIGPDGFIRDLAIREADGRLHAVEKAIDATNQPIFLFHRDTKRLANTFYIARPTPGMVSGEKIIRITKSIYDDKGAFRGVCIVSISLDAFIKGYANLLPARYTSVDVFRRDGGLVASTNPTRKGDLTANEKLLFKDIIPATPLGVYRITSADSNSGDLIAYRELQRYPVVLAVTANWSQFMERWWESTVVLVVSALIGILVIAALTWRLVRRLDIEHATKQALLNNEQRIMESQRLSGIGYYEHEIDAEDLGWSRNMYEIHGLDPRTFTPTADTYLSLVIPEDRPGLLALWESFAKSPRSASLECRITRPDGEIRYIRYSWKILDACQGVPARSFGVAQDVTAMRNAENIIRDDEERLRDIVECSSDYIWELDDKGVITLFSGAAGDQFGADTGTSRRILSKDMLDVKGGDVIVLERNIRNRAKFRSLLVPVKNTDADVRWVRISGNPRFDSQGKYLGYRGAGTDVTELYRRQERDEALRKAEALGRLASGMAHEINNLLQPIVIYANLGIAQTEPVAGVRQYFSRIGLAAERSMMIVKNVLAFARQSPPSRENVNVLDVVRETVDLIGGALVPGTALEVSENVSDLAVRVDRTGLTQVLTNLLTNAAEAQPLGGRIGVEINAVNLSVESARALALAPGFYCRLTVKDSGVGIPADKLGKVFDPFFTTKPQGKGTGLGLSVVSGLAKSWGGTVTVESVVDAGTVFAVYLPVAERHLQAAQ